MPGKVKGNIAKLEQLKARQPELAPVVDKSLPALRRRLGFFREPAKALEEALGRIYRAPARNVRMIASCRCKICLHCLWRNRSI